VRSDDSRLEFQFGPATEFLAFSAQRDAGDEANRDSGDDLDPTHFQNCHHRTSIRLNALWDDGIATS